MLNNYMKISLLSFFLSVFALQLTAQNVYVSNDPGAIFRKQQRRAAPVVKTYYFFDTGIISGREYLKRQDLFDAKGNYKSSGLFSEDGNKAADIRYTYSPAGKLERSEKKIIGQNVKEISYYNENERIVKTERKTRGDTLIDFTTFEYNGAFLKEQKTIRGDKEIHKIVHDNTYNSFNQLLTGITIEYDSTGNPVSHKNNFTVNEYDDKGLILQTTVYNNKEKRKMLSWIYYKYQLDNDYKIIKQTGFDEEQNEVFRNELTYKDSTIQSTIVKQCNCPAKTLDFVRSSIAYFNAYGEMTKEEILDASGKIIETDSHLYNDYGFKVEYRKIIANEPEKLIKSKTILEYYADQAQSLNKTK